MSEESLRRFLERLNGDAAFVERLKANPGEVLAGFELSATERIALGTNDADGLRRLAGQDVAGFDAVRGTQSHGLAGAVCAQLVAMMTTPSICTPPPAPPSPPSPVLPNATSAYTCVQLGP
jgi:hypothetical protein